MSSPRIFYSPDWPTKANETSWLFLKQQIFLGRQKMPKKRTVFVGSFTFEFTNY